MPTDFAFLFAPGDASPLYVPSHQTAPPVTIGGSLGMSATTGRVTIRNLSQTTLQGLEVAPIGFSVTSVGTRDCGLTEGRGIACNHPLASGQTADIRFATTSVSGAASAHLLGDRNGATAAVAFVAAGNACPDLEATVAGAQAQMKALQGEIASSTAGCRGSGGRCRPGPSSR